MAKKEDMTGGELGGGRLDRLDRMKKRQGKKKEEEAKDVSRYDDNDPAKQRVTLKFGEDEKKATTKASAKPPAKPKAKKKASGVSIPYRGSGTGSRQMLEGTTLDGPMPRDGEMTPDDWTAALGSKLQPLGVDPRAIGGAGLIAAQPFLGPVAGGALMGGGDALMHGASLGDALDQAAIGAGTGYLGGKLAGAVGSGLGKVMPKPAWMQEAASGAGAAMSDVLPPSMPSPVPRQPMSMSAGPSMAPAPSAAPSPFAPPPSAISTRASSATLPSAAPEMTAAMRGPSAAPPRVDDSLVRAGTTILPPPQGPNLGIGPEDAGLFRAGRVDASGRVLPQPMTKPSVGGTVTPDVLPPSVGTPSSPPAGDMTSLMRPPSPAMNMQSMQRSMDPSAIMQQLGGLPPDVQLALLSSLLAGASAGVAAYPMNERPQTVAPPQPQAIPRPGVIQR